VYVGSDRPYKSLGTLLAAFQRVHAAVPQARLELTLAAESFQAQPGTVALGQVGRAAVRQLLSRAQVLVMPSLAETVGLPLLEAMDAGCVVVSADLPYAREVSGNAALYFPAGDAAACAAQVQAVCSDSELRETLADRGRKRLLLRRAGAPYRQLLDQLVSRVP
jgi:glycosyltransferase involved in cell wall biosynthesis